MSSGDNNKNGKQPLRNGNLPETEQTTTQTTTQNTKNTTAALGQPAPASASTRPVPTVLGEAVVPPHKGIETSIPADNPALRATDEIQENVDRLMNRPHPTKPAGISRTHWRTLNKGQKQFVSDYWSDATCSIANHNNVVSTRVGDISLPMQDPHPSSGESAREDPPSRDLGTAISRETAVDFSGDYDTDSPDAQWQARNKLLHDHIHSGIVEYLKHLRDQNQSYLNKLKLFKTLKIDSEESLKWRAETLPKSTQRMMDTGEDSIASAQSFMSGVDRIEDVSSRFQAHLLEELEKRVTGEVREEALADLRDRGLDGQAFLYHAQEVLHHDDFKNAVHNDVQARLDLHRSTTKQLTQRYVEQTSKPVDTPAETMQNIVQSEELFTSEIKDFESKATVFSFLDDEHASEDKMNDILNGLESIIKVVALVQAQDLHVKKEAMRLIFEANFDTTVIDDHYSWFDLAEFVAPPPAPARVRTHISNGNTAAPREAHTAVSGAAHYFARGSFPALGPHTANQHNSTPTHWSSEATQDANTGSGNRGRPSIRGGRGRGSLRCPEIDAGRGSGGRTRYH